VNNTAEHLLQVFETSNRGYGLRATSDLPSQAVVIEYCGEYITHKTYNARCKTMNPASTYFMLCDQKYGIDARICGNLARFVNHSCQPNMKSIKRIVRGTTRIFLVTLRQISALDELTIEYNDTKEFPCYCSSCLLA
jgi:SET domain-containing protein